jgi:hypothetical protein
VRVRHRRRASACMRADRLRACGAPTVAGRAQVRASAAAPADRRAPHAARRAGACVRAHACLRACEHSPRHASTRSLLCAGACGRRGADQAHDLVFLRPGAVVVMVYPYRRAGHSRFRPAVRRCAAIPCAADVDGFGCGAAPLLFVFVCVFVRLMRCSVCAFVLFCVCLFAPQGLRADLQAARVLRARADDRGAALPAAACARCSHPPTRTPLAFQWVLFVCGTAAA